MDGGVIFIHLLNDNAEVFDILNQKEKPGQPSQNATTMQLNPLLARASEIIISSRYEEFESMCLS